MVRARQNIQAALKNKMRLLRYTNRGCRKQRDAVECDRRVAEFSVLRTVLRSRDILEPEPV